MAFTGSQAERYNCNQGQKFLHRIFQYPSQKGRLRSKSEISNFQKKDFIGKSGRMEGWKGGRLAMRNGLRWGQDLLAARRQGSRHITRLRGTAARTAALQVDKGHQSFDWVPPSLHPSIPPSLHPSIPPSFHSSILPIFHPSILPFFHPSNLPSFQSSNLPSFHSSILPFSHSSIPIPQCPVPEISMPSVAIKMGRRQGGPSRTGSGRAHI